MNDVTIIDQFLNTFAAYIDSGFGLLRGEVAFLTATLIVIDMTIAGLYWAMSHATGQGEDVIAKLLRKVLYVGAFAYIINNFNWLASIVFRSFAGLGITATGSAITMENFLQPGRLAKTGIDAGAPILEQIGEMAGFPEVFVNLDPIVVMFLAWLVVVLCFFVLAIQLFITLIEFKLTTLAGFVLVPFALWNKTAFLAEKVLGNVASGVKVLVLAVIVGIGSGLFAQFKSIPPSRLLTTRWSSCWPRSPCWRSGFSALASPRASSPVRRSSALAQWPVLLSALPARPSPSAPPRRAWVAPWLLVRAWPRLPPSWPVAVRAPPRRRPAVRSRRSRPVPPPLAAAQRARWRAWATSPRPARRQPGEVLHPALPLPGNAWPLPSALAGMALLPMAARVRHPVRCRRRGRIRRRYGADTGTARLGQAPASPPATHPRRDHHRPRAARWRWRRLRPGAEPARFRFIRRTDHAIQETAGALRRHAAACHAVPSCRPGVGQAHRLAARPGEELAPDGLRLPDACTADGRRRCGARRNPS